MFILYVKTVGGKCNIWCFNIHTVVYLATAGLFAYVLSTAPQSSCVSGLLVLVFLESFLTSAACLDLLDQADASTVVMSDAEFS